MPSDPMQAGECTACASRRRAGFEGLCPECARSRARAELEALRAAQTEKEIARRVTELDTAKHAGDVRVAAPIWLELHPELRDHARALRALAPIVDVASARACSGVAQELRRAAWTAWQAADKRWGAAVRAAVSDAVRDANVSPIAALDRVYGRGLTSTSTPSTKRR